MLKSYYHSKLLEAGCDEVGRGCIAGPVVAASIIFPKEYRNDSIKDSKKISHKKRIEIEKEIKKHAISWSIGEIGVGQIDKENILAFFNCCFRINYSKRKYPAIYGYGT